MLDESMDLHNSNNHNNVRSKDNTPDEMEEEDDEDIDESVNQDNDENDEDDKDDLETSTLNKIDSISNKDVQTSDSIDNSSIHSIGQITSTLSNTNSRRKNRRKQFKPRNILYDGNEDEIVEETDKKDNDTIEDSEHGSDQGPLNLSGHNGNGSNISRMLLPRKMLDQQLLTNQKGDSDQGSCSNAASSPMDLSNYQASDMEQNRNFNGSNEDRSSISEEAEGRSRVRLIDEENSDGCDEDNKMTSAVAAKGLSVVRPEVLFGENNSSSVTSGSPTSSPGITGPPTSQASLFGGAAFPPALMPLLGLPGAASKTSPAAGLASSDAMKDAFQEVLKLYGVPSELAEAIAKNAQNTQGKHPKFS